MSFNLIITHMFMVLAASVCAIIVGIPLGILAYSKPSTKGVILRIVDILQTIPALALLGIIMIFVGAGKTTVIVGITLYSLLPIVRNTYIGLSEIDPGIKEAARGVGMTRWERIMQVEFPIAFPTIFTGIRIAIVNAIGIAVFAAFVGGGGIGSVMNKAIRTQNMGMILIATGALMLIAVILDFLMSFSENRMRKSHSSMKKVISSLVVIGIAFCCTVPFVVSQANSEGKELIMYDGDLAETQVLPRMVKMLVEDQTNVKVTIKDQMSQVNNFKTMNAKNYTCDLMPTYDGTVLTTFMHMDPTDVPDDMTLYDFVNEQVQKKHGMVMLGKIGFDNTYTLAVPKDIQKKYKLETFSDLTKVAPKLVFGGEHEFFTEEGSAKFKPLAKFYGFKFKDTKAVDVSLKYSGIERGEYQVTDVFATDGLNRKAGLVILEDDKNYFPEYNGVFLVREDTFERFQEDAPNLRQIISQLDDMISTEEMIDMSYQVDVEGKNATDVARAYLVKKGLLSE